MKRLVLAAVAAALLIPAVAIATEGVPSPSDAASAACSAERGQVGSALVKSTYGTNHNRSNAMGKCVTKHTATEQANQSNAAKACKAEQSDANFAPTHSGKTFD